MEYKTYKYNNYNIHTINTDRFKNIHMEIVLRNNINKDTLLSEVFLIHMLMESSKKYKTKRDIVLEQEELYDAACYISYKKVGSSLMSKLIIDFLNPKYTKDDYLEEAIQLPFELLLNPNIENNEFNKEVFNTIYKRLENAINTQKENPSSYASIKALETMDKDSISAININGTIEDLNKIDNNSLLESYNYLLNKSNIDINIIGDINEEEVINIINKYAKFNDSDREEINYYITNKERDTVIRQSESTDNTQTQLVYLYNTNNLTEYEREYVMPIFNIILGGGTLESKLYKSLREDKSLCYGVRSATFKYDNLLRITTGIDKSNIELAISTIDETVKDMTNVSKQELDRAISLYETIINMYLDDPEQILELYFYQYIFNRDSLEEQLNKIKKVSIKEVEDLYSKLKLNTIYVLEGDKHE